MFKTNQESLYSKSYEVYNYTHSISSKLAAGEGLVTGLPTWMEQLCHVDKIRVLGCGMGWVKQHQSKYGYSHAMWGGGRPHFQHLVQVSKAV